MEFNQDQISAIIGSKELEIIGLRMQVNQLLQQVKDLSVPPTPNKDE